VVSAALFLNSYAQELTYLEGSVSLSNSKNGKFKKLTKGDKVPFGSFLKTDQVSFAIITFPGGSTLKLDPESLVEIKEVKAEEDKKTTNIFYLIKGAIISKFIKSADKELVVESEHIALAVRGTEFFFGEEDNQFYAAVNEGEVAVIKKDDYDHESLEAGKSLVIENKKALTLPAAYLWAKKLSWGKGKLKTKSGFRSKEIRGLRKKEVRERLKQLRKRKRKVFKGKLKGRLKKVLDKKKSAIKNKRPRKVQKFKQRLRKRKILRRRRN
jgi:hypothetical protein